MRFRSTPCDRKNTLPFQSARPRCSTRIAAMSATSGMRRIGEVADARAAVAIAREEQIAPERAVGNRSRREPLVDLIDLVLGQIGGATLG